MNESLQNMLDDEVGVDYVRPLGGVREGLNDGAYRLRSVLRTLRLVIPNSPLLGELFDVAQNLDAYAEVISKTVGAKVAEDVRNADDASMNCMMAAMAGVRMARGEHSDP
jgi:hypothetical protein